jgi:hypothetical protein
LAGCKTGDRTEFSGGALGGEPAAKKPAFAMAPDPTNYPIKIPAQANPAGTFNLND